MQIINQKKTKIGLTPLTMKEGYAYIEKCTRICYDSKTKGDPKKFVESIIKRGHLQPIEHATLAYRTEKVKFPKDKLNKIKCHFKNKHTNIFNHRDRVYIIGNWRCFLDGFNYLVHLPPETYEPVYDWDEIPAKYHRITYHFVLDRATSHELVRHRPAAICQRSQRYCFEDDLKVIKQWYWKDGEPSEVEKNCLLMIEATYKELIEQGRKRQEARSILPNCTATELYMTTSKCHWDFIKELRTAKGAYPQMVKLMETAEL